MAPAWPRDAVVLLTGATSGLGKELLSQLSRVGANVHVILRPCHQGTSQGAEVSHLAATLTFCDLSDPGAVEKAARKIVETVPMLTSVLFPKSVK